LEAAKELSPVLDKQPIANLVMTTTITITITLTITITITIIESMKTLTSSLF
jgi:hypothetical protein